MSCHIVINVHQPSKIVKDKNGSLKIVENTIGFCCSNVEEDYIKRGSRAMANIEVKKAKFVRENFKKIMAEALDDLHKLKEKNNLTEK